MRAGKPHKFGKDQKLNPVATNLQVDRLIPKNFLDIIYIEEIMDVVKMESITI